MILGFGNNVVSSLASDITASQTTFSVIPGDGPLFAALLTSDFSNKSTTLKNYAKITLTDSGETSFEVCHLTAVNGDTLTVIRGQEGTAAKGWALKDVVANFATRGSENSFPQIAHIQSGFYTSGTAGGTANALTLELPTTFFLNGSVDWVLKTPIVVYPSQNNTGAATLQLTLGGRVLGTFPLYKGNKAALAADDILKDVALVCLLDNTKTFFNVANPGAIYAGLGTAAFANLVTSKTDYTAGRVLTTGWMTLGGYGTDNLIAAADAKKPLRNGFYAVSSEPAYGNASLISFGYDSGSQVHIIAKQGGQAPALGVCGSTPQGEFGNWGKIYTEFQKPTPGEVGAVAKTGDTMSGRLIMNIDGEAIRLQPKTAGYASYIICYDSANANHWYVGAGSTTNTNVTLLNYKGANNSITLNTDGTVNLNPTQGKSATVNGPLQVGAVGSAIINIGDNDSGLRSSKDGQVDLWANGKMFGYWNTTTFSFTGQIIPTNYSNFDARYQAKGSYTPAGQAYTKAESDARYGVVNGIRRGGQQIRNPTDTWFGNWESPAGCVLTGIQMDGRSDGRKLGVYFRQLQYLNKQTNAWVNVGD
ncbi:phage tail protein [Enterobacter kobei]|uniref:phage tail protein n=1 Tax=Enterobacter kobei TaxID=208224 RepID=UPI002A81033D|nr:phage tail protein [Enterobacter kobei]